jgi:hypothetical protein
MPVQVRGLPTHFGDLDLTIQPDPEGGRIDYRIRIAPRGDQARRELTRIVLSPRVPEGRGVAGMTVDGNLSNSFTDGVVVIPNPPRDRELKVRLSLSP